MESMCRICSDSDLPKVDVFATKFADHSLAYLINRYLYFKVEKEDEFPNHICTLCLNKMEHIHKFAQLAALMQEKFALLAAEEKKEIFVLSANDEKMENAAPSVTEVKAESPRKKADNIKSPIKTPSTSPNQTKETQEKKILVLGSGGKKKVIVLKVPKDLNLTNNSENKNSSSNRNVNGRYREENSPTIDDMVAEVKVDTSSLHTLDNNSIELSNIFNRSGNVEVKPQTMREDLVVETEIKKLGVKRKLDGTPKQKGTEYDVKCNFCQRRFSEKKKMENHLLTHSLYRPYKCPHCDTNYAVEHLLQRHIKRRHSNRSYQCDICKKVFLEKYTLSLHTLNHSDKKPHTCYVCKLGFVRKDKFDQHFRQKHMGEIPYKCEICERTFMAKQSLENHLYEHRGTKPYFCPVCYKTFGLESGLKRHMINTHQNVKPYKCDICKRCLSQKSNLKNHIYLHLNLLERPFKCEVCDESFQRSDGLRKHFLTQRHRLNLDGDLWEKCGVCFKKLPPGTDWAKHEQVHSKQRTKK